MHNEDFQSSPDLKPHIGDDADAGNSLETLGNLRRNAEHMQQAVAAFTEAVATYEREEFRMTWALRSTAASPAPTYGDGRAEGGSLAGRFRR
jgi:hypothetical protein